MMFFTPGVMAAEVTPGAERTCAPQAILTAVAPAALSAASTSLPMVSLSGQAGVVSSTLSETVVPSTARSFTIPRLTRSRCSSGSFTFFRASSALLLSMAMGGVLITVGRRVDNARSTRGLKRPRSGSSSSPDPGGWTRISASSPRRPTMFTSTSRKRRMTAAVPST